MRGKRLITSALTAAALTVSAQVLAAPAQADPDTDFYHELHTYGIYGQKDYNAWIGKLTCKRLSMNTDADLYKSTEWILKQLDRDSTTAQSWQFLGSAMKYYCPDQLPRLQSVGQPQVPPGQTPPPPGQPLPAEQQ